jgi:glycosyltransferase involved in cell wall biosynthesis
MKNKNFAGEAAEILIISSYPPRECGIATYTQDLVKSLNNKFSAALTLKVCALESNGNTYPYPEEVKYTLKTSQAKDYEKMALLINRDDNIRIVLIQHEFGFFHKQEQPFLQFLAELSKPVIIVFHTVLPNPDEKLRSKVRSIAGFCDSIIVMTRTSVEILATGYEIPREKISVIAHGTHLVAHSDTTFLKEKHGLTGRKVLTTFGLLSAGKSIETTLDALPAIVQKHPDVIFLIIGKTHPEVVKTEGENYREMLAQKVVENNLGDHVLFINKYLALPDLLEYLQLTDIYLFTTNDPFQAVSGTFVYAMSCACPIISTPIPHAKEVLTSDTGIIFDFRNFAQLAESVNRLLNDKLLRQNMSINTLEKIVSTAWENSAVSHAMLFEKVAPDKIGLHYDLPAINLGHMKRMTTDTGIIQFSKFNQPDISTGYTLDDNARALVATCMQYKLSGDKEYLGDIHKYLRFVNFCLRPEGNFLNYVDSDRQFTSQNETTNLDDSNGRAIWALGHVISLNDLLPAEILAEAESMLSAALPRFSTVHSTRAMAFAIKGLYSCNTARKSLENQSLLVMLANRLVQMYRHESEENWAWFEGYLTYANSILPEAMLYAWLLTRDPVYKEIALASLDFLLSHTFNENGIEVISNRSWLQKGEVAAQFGEQPIDVAYTIMTLSKFYDVFRNGDYHMKMETAFNWFLGKNRLHQVIYNPCTSGCYDGLEETHVNLNQGAESTVSYLMARLTMEKYLDGDKYAGLPMRNHSRIHIKQKKCVYSTKVKNLEVN